MADLDSRLILRSTQHVTLRFADWTGSIVGFAPEPHEETTLTAEQLAEFIRAVQDAPDDGARNDG